MRRSAPQRSPWSYSYRGRHLSTVAVDCACAWLSGREASDSASLDADTVDCISASGLDGHARTPGADHDNLDIGAWSWCERPLARSTASSCDTTYCKCDERSV